MNTPHTAQKALPEQTALYGGKYTIVRPLGSGGFGITYLAQHHLLGDVAIKELFLNSGNVYCTREEISGRTVVPHFDRAQFDKFKERFLNEAKTIYGLRKVRGVVNVLDIFEENGTVYFSMEYLNGEKLDDYVRNRHPLSEKESEQIVLSLCDTMAQVHSQQILHCDIKPSNIILSPEGEITLIDFGIARYYEISDDNATRAAIYSPGYSPPEQKIPNEPLGTYSDVFSLGATAYFVFTGQPPQSMDERMAKGYLSPRHFNPTISRSIEAAINQSLEPKPQDRPQTIASFLQVFQQASDTTQIELPKEALTATALDVEKTAIAAAEQVDRGHEDTIVEVERTDATKIDTQSVNGETEADKTIVEPVISDDSKDKTIVDNSAGEKKKPGFWENTRVRFGLAAILLIVLIGVIVWLRIPERQPVIKVAAQPMPDYKVMVDLESESLIVGEKQLLQIRTEPVPDSGFVVSIYVNGKKTDENALGASIYTSDVFPNPGKQAFSVKIQVVRSADKQIKTDSTLLAFEVFDKNTPPPPSVPDIRLLPLSVNGQWYVQLPNQSRTPTSLENNLTKIGPQGHVAKANNAKMEDGSTNIGLEFVPGHKSGAKVGGTIILPKSLPSNAVLVADIGFRKGGEKKPIAAYEIRLQYANGPDELISGGLKKYDGKLKHICVPIRRKPMAIYFEVNAQNDPDDERLILVNPRILNQKTNKIQCN